MRLTGSTDCMSADKAEGLALHDVAQRPVGASIRAEHEGMAEQTREKIDVCVVFLARLTWLAWCRPWRWREWLPF